MYNNEELNVIHFSNLQLCFDFYSKFKIETVKDMLSSSLSKKIKIKDKHNSEFVDLDTFTLIHNPNGGSNMLTLKTCLLPYSESKILLAKILKWIKENGKTDDNCTLKVNVSFDNKKLGGLLNIQKLNIAKFILDFDEDLVYKNFPNRINSLYAKSIKFLIPLSQMSEPSPASKVWSNYIYANNDYYAISWCKLKDSMVSFNYIGGLNYESKYNEILNTINYFIISIFKVLDNPSYSKEDKEKLNKIIKENSHFIKSYNSYHNLKKNFPEIKLLVDLKTDKQILELYYPKLRDSIFDLLLLNNMKEGLINYDSDAGKIQLKDTKLLNCFSLNNFDIFDSELSGNINRCDVFNCEIINSNINTSNVFGSSTVNNSEINNCYINKNVVCSNSLILGSMGVFSGEMESCVFREGRATKFARHDDNTTIIKMKKI